MITALLILVGTALPDSVLEKRRERYSHNPTLCLEERAPDYLIGDDTIRNAKKLASECFGYAHRDIPCPEEGSGPSPAEIEDCKLARQEDRDEFLHLLSNQAIRFLEIARRRRDNDF